jgi:P27 family predicted phage terminase small subunit
MTMKAIGRLWPMPKNLIGYGAEFYTRVGRQLVSYEVLTDLDREAFISLASSYDLMMTSQDAIAKEGATVKGSKDEIKKHPGFTTYKMASDIFTKLSKRFYLAPSDREGVKLNKPEKKSGKKKYFTQQDT